jgi:Skp family chaperone for outer membrane proteins
MSDEPTLQSIAQQLESEFARLRAELHDFRAEVLDLVAEWRRQRQSRSNGDEPQRES